MKIHFVNRKAKEEDYKQSPHIVKAIRDQQWSLCELGAWGSITNNISAVTCKGCIKIYQEDIK